jgi:hypothetical protein
MRNLQFRKRWKGELSSRAKERALALGLSHFAEETVARWQRPFATLVEKAECGATPKTLS